MRDVLTRRAVTAGCAAHQLAVFVKQADRDAVQFRFGRVAQVGIELELQSFCHAPVKILQLVFGEGIIQRQHRDGVSDRTECLHGLRADALRG